MNDTQMLQAAEHQQANNVLNPAQLLEIAIEKGADIDKLEKLMDMQERWESQQAEKLYNIALSQFRAEAKSIPKTKTVSYKSRKTGASTEYRYAPLSDIADYIGPILSKHGLSYFWETEQIDNTVKVTCILRHKNGHSESTSLTGLNDESGGKNSIQSVGSSVSYLERYTLKAITGLSEHDDDDDGITSEPPHIAPDFGDSRFFGFLASADALGMYLLSEYYLKDGVDSDSAKQWNNFYRMFPDGFKADCRKRVEALINAGADIMLCIDQALNDDDHVLLYENISENNESKKLLSLHVGEFKTNQIKSLLARIDNE